ncbi:MAG: sulfatase-like hydrolase/transferase, partial [Porticoccaceae bacterium]|nr:sulfatase-like hydrolase/transferase [Porticoccaceae bacterium]
PNQRFPDLGLPESEITLPELLSGVGYQSALVGKWHLGGKPEFHPLNHGFDEFHGFLSGGHDYFDIDPADSNPHSYRQLLESHGQRVGFDGYLTDRLTDYAVNFIGRHAQQPFFLFVSYNAPHAPLQAPENYLQRVANIEDKKRRTYAAMVTAVDDGVGRILSALKESGLSEDTLVFFMSDNGGVPSSWPDNGPFRGMKGTLLEGGIHVPYLLSWPGRLAPGEYQHPVVSHDIYATAAQVAGVSLPNDRVMDSVALVESDEQGQAHIARSHNRTLLWKQADYQWAVREGTEKALYVKGDGVYLFDLEKDQGETTDKSHSSHEKAQHLKQLFKHWDKTLPEARYQSTGIAKDAQEDALRALRDTRAGSFDRERQ